ncbi:MAG: hypothetical protein HY909_13340 [Deltaproteobacteria bacterium]|nr:hypothetical protein [Deltaproteobacteria bacterium]
MVGRGLLRCLGALTLTFWTPGLLADELPVRLEVPDAALLRRLGDEVTALGHPLAEAPREGIAAVTVGRLEGRWRAVIFVPGAGAAVVEAPVEGPPQEFALRVVEALRARVLAAGLPRGPSRVVPAPLAREPRWSLGVGLAVTASPGGVGALLGPWFRFALEGPWTVELVASGPSTEGAIEGVGDGTFRVFSVGVGCARRLLRGRLGELHLGARALGLASDASRQTPSARFTAGAWSAAVAGVARGRLTLAPPLSLALDLSLGSALAVTEVQVGGRPVARWGQPWLALALAAELTW